MSSGSSSPSDTTPPPKNELPPEVIDVWSELAKEIGNIVNEKRGKK